jgi:hypothetical protein
MAPKERKFSDLFAEQTSRVKGILRSYRDECDQLGIDAEDEDMRELNRIIDKFTDPNPAQNMYRQVPVFQAKIATEDE